MYVAKHHKKRLHCLREKAVLCFNLDGTKTFKREKNTVLYTTRQNGSSESGSKK